MTDANAETELARKEREGKAIGPVEPDCRALFEQYYSEWKADTEFLSNLNGAEGHRAFVKICSMGHRAIPFIREKIKAEPDPIVDALEYILPGAELYFDVAVPNLADVCAAWDSYLDKSDSDGTDLVHIHNNIDPECPLYSPEGKLIGIIENDTALNNVRWQISRLKKGGYYIMYNGKKVEIDCYGNLGECPEGFYDASLFYAGDML